MYGLVYGWVGGFIIGKGVDLGFYHVIIEVEKDMLSVLEFRLLLKRGPSVSAGVGECVNLGFYGVIIGVHVISFGIPFVAQKG